jgi:peptidoglycan-associated lipoprotein
MKMKGLGLLLLVAILGLSLGGCGCFMQAMKGETAPPPAPPAKVVAPEEKKEIVVKKEAPAPAPVPAPAPAPVVAAALQDIFFDFDKYNIRPADAEILKKNYDWFKANSKRMRVEGHCDERGTIEYNLVLGQKRADAAKKYLTDLGVDEKRMETVSYGKEKPLDPGHNEAAWAKNRRVHFTPLQ